ncbi:hypothetical protein [Cryobacterium luteum]|uniref:Uncharacterized protein n=1 Tax=Cryobacterium luteum TaxID=1424661 RepID=A0A5F0D6A4_9MICO|nr:hypothetical protein [Cryobacterium luteum]TFB89965.1 hypothetical protein E3O10_07545 [Cryobacterium luteum]
MKLEISTSPRVTWVWAQDPAEAGSLREILTAAHCSYSDATGKNAESRILDLDIGIVAAEGLTALKAAGYSFQWHSTQHELNRQPTLFGLTIEQV